MFSLEDVQNIENNMIKANNKLLSGILKPKSHTQLTPL